MPPSTPTAPAVVSVSGGPEHGPRKPVRAEILLVAGLGVEGDAHAGGTVRHRSRARAHPDWPNRRQVHLVGVELHTELAARGFAVARGAMGENALTASVDLLSLPVGAELALGGDAVVEVTGLRNPCSQPDGVHPGLMAAVLERGDDGALVRRAGVMAVVLGSGRVRPLDAISVALPAGPHVALAPV